MVRVTYDTGAVVEMSPIHPTADGRLFGDLDAPIDGVSRIRRVPYDNGRTFDILPGSDSGIYYSNEIPIGSTLFAGVVGEPEAPRCCHAVFQWNNETKQHEVFPR